MSQLEVGDKRRKEHKDREQEGGGITTLLNCGLSKLKLFKYNYNCDTVYYCCCSLLLVI